MEFKKGGCKNCGSTNTDFRIDKSYHCRKCGYDSREEEKFIMDHKTKEGEV